jgi:hypothetical protein
VIPRANYEWPGEERMAGGRAVGRRDGDDGGGVQAPRANYEWPGEERMAGGRWSVEAAVVKRGQG